LGVPANQSGAMNYDAAGNLTNDTYTGAGSRTYDAENKIVSAWGGNNQTQYYTYNAYGERVRRKVDGVETWQIYGIDGELVAEYAANATSSSPQKEYGYRNGQLLITAETGPKIQWLIPDHLGTPRMIFDQTGTLGNIKRHDYLPFGEELFAGTGGRTTARGYASGDGVRQQFTAYERDFETGLDYAKARYYSSVQGRFTSVDPLAASATAQDPASWNRYAYTANNPIGFVDPTGQAATDDYYASNDGTISVYETPDTFDRFYVENSNVAGSFDLVAQLNRNAAGLVEFPASGTGFDRYGGVDAGGVSGGETVGAGDHFLQPVVAAALFGVVNVINDQHPQWNISLGDMSSSNGSDPWQQGQQHHAGHGHNGNRSGLDIDFRYLDNNGVSFQSPTATSDRQFSQPNNQTVFQTAGTFGFSVNWRGPNAPVMANSSAARGHDNHGHLGFSTQPTNIQRYRVTQTLPNGTQVWGRVP